VLHQPDARRAPARLIRVVVPALLVAGVVFAIVSPAGAATSSAVEQAGNELTAARAAVLGAVEGVTEYLPVSSTGHLHVTERMLDVGTTPETKDAADTYAITIQAGAILAVLLLYRHRLGTMVNGALGRDDTGREVLVAVAIAFVPAAIVGVALEQPIKNRLFGAGPIIIAWIVGGLVILAFAPRLRELTGHGVKLDQITHRQAAIIGVAQVLALWPGTSRSLVTILAGIFVGLNLVASVEFSFLLGFVTLAAATGFEALRHGTELVDTYGVANPMIGFVVAFVTAAIAIKWMIAYLERHDLSIFGWYRIVIAAVTIVLLATSVI
jgi:undecaprenyl-diphosphatase